MKDDRMEIRISRKKKESIRQMAKDMNINVSILIDIMIDQYMSQNTYNINIYDKEAIVRHFMYIYNIIDNNLSGSVREELLKEVGELECLI